MLEPPVRLTRRRFLVSTLATAALPALAQEAPPLDAALPDDTLFPILDEVGPLEGPVFHPTRALEAMIALQALGQEAGTQALRRYLSQRAEPPTGLFAVIRCLSVIPERGIVGEFPAVPRPGSLRPPALGAPNPAPPADPTALPRFPAMLLADVPLVVVLDYTLSGHPEPLSMHLDGLADTPWVTEPFSPADAQTLRGQIGQWSRWPQGSRVHDALEEQVQRYAAG